MMRDTKQTLREQRLVMRQVMMGTRFRISLVVAIVLFGILYIGQTSSVSTKGFVISDLQKQVETLERENRALDVEVANHRAMAKVEGRLAATSFVSAGQLEHLTPVGTAVALR